MIISHPILPQNHAGMDDDARLHDLLSNRVDPAQGIYPVSFQDRWHGGIHLMPGNEPIRAIADGTVVAYRVAGAAKDYAGRHLDTSFVLLKHETETGENTSVVFYSLYMHLAARGRLSAAQQQQLPDFLRHATASDTAKSGSSDLRVWRKDVLGFGGWVYANDPRVHFEIFTSDDALADFWHDSTAIGGGKHGNDDAFGDMHFVLPPGSAFQAEHPQADKQHRIALAHGKHYTLDRGDKGACTQPLHVSVRLEKGKRIATTWVWQGDTVATPPPVSPELAGAPEHIQAAPESSGKGRYVPLGDPVLQDDYEYTLYELACALYPDCPSAGFEWLRFGRLLGPDTTQHKHNWQLIRYAEDHIGYIDLADSATQAAHLSDADFPYWQGWKKIDEGSAVNASDGLCDVSRLLELLDAPDSNHDNKLSRDEFANHAHKSDIAKKLRHLIVKNPTEWDDSDLDARYARERKPEGPLHEKASWDTFKKHVKALAFWSATGGLDRSLWHFHPLQFVHHFRKCGWLNSDEMIQLFPQSAMRKSHGHWVSENVHIRTSTVQSYNTALNKACRRYVIITPLRMAAFYANAMQETMWFGTLHENNSNTRYWPWDGRGFLQLTWPDNYIKYWRFTGKKITNKLAQRLHHAAVQANSQGSNAPLVAMEAHVSVNIKDWRRIIGDGKNPWQSADSTGAYWAWSSASKYADVYPANVRTSKTVSGHPHVYYTSRGMGQVAATVNVGHPSTHYSSINGIVARFQAYNTCEVILLDMPKFPDQHGKPQPLPQNYMPRHP